MAEQIGRMIKGPHTYTKSVTARLRRRIEREFAQAVLTEVRATEPDEINPDEPLPKIAYRGWDD